MHEAAWRSVLLEKVIHKLNPNIDRRSGLGMLLMSGSRPAPPLTRFCGFMVEIVAGLRLASGVLSVPGCVHRGRELRQPTPARYRKEGHYGPRFALTF